jgi:DNA repair exonuclease SbcCD ATPase subunit
MINSSADLGGDLPHKNREDGYSETLELESNSSSYNKIVGDSLKLDSAMLNQHQIQRDRFTTKSSDVLADPWQQPTMPVGCQPTIIPSTEKQLDVNTELDLLLKSLELANPHSPNLELTEETSWIADLLGAMVGTEAVTQTHQLLKELSTTRTQLTIARTELQSLSQQDRDRVDRSLLQIKQLKFRTQQIAQYSKNQVEKVRDMLDSIEHVRSEIVTSLDKFGGYEEIHSMLAQLETTRHALVLAHDRVTTGQEAFYDSLREIQDRVAERSQESELKLNQYQESIHSLSQTISSDRLQIAVMSVELSTKLKDLHDLNAQIATMHPQILATSQILQSKIIEIDRDFVRLSQSVQQEKEQFYELTVEAIEKANLVQSQLADIIKQTHHNRDSISLIKAEILSDCHNFYQEIEQKINNLDLDYHEMISTWSDLQSHQKYRDLTSKKLSTWLWILSFFVGVTLLLSLRILMSIR